MQEEPVIDRAARSRLGGVGGDAGPQPADELEPEDAAIVEAIPGGGHRGLHHGGDEDVGALAEVEAMVAGRGNTDDQSSGGR